MKLGLGICGLTLTLVGCSSQPPTYQVPDYYDTRTISQHYQVGDVRPLNELRCSKREDKCDPNYQPPEPANWITHRTYKRAYLFE